MQALFQEIISVLIIGGIIQGFYIALLLNSKRIKRSRANLFLSILLIIMSFSIAHILYSDKVMIHLSANVYAMGDPTFLLIAPMLWLYVRELTENKVHLSWRHALHFAPFILLIIFSLVFPMVPSGKFLRFLHEYHRLINILFWVAVVVHFTFYLSSIHQKLRRYRILVHQEVSNTEGINVSWVRFFMAVFLVIAFFFLFSLFAVIHWDNRTWHKETTAFILSISIFALGYKGILQREIFYPIDQPIDTNSSSDSISDIDQATIDQLTRYMDKHKPYLNPELTLSELAKNFGVSRSQLSRLINAGIGDNFYDFINKYRVEEVKKLIANPQMRHYSLLGLALEAGFKSKSTFNLIFKRFTGLTPSEYKKNLANNS